MRTKLLLFSVIISGNILAQGSGNRIDESYATLIAGKQYALLRNLNVKDFNSLKPYIRFKKSVGDTSTYYVVEFRNQPGFVVLPATKLTDPYICISTKDRFDTNTMPPQMKYMLRFNERQVLCFIRANEKKRAVDLYAPDWKFLENSYSGNLDSPGVTNTFDSVGPLLTSLWGQGDYYNRKCPYHGPACDNGHTPAGCGPIAMAQIMRYHEYPDFRNYNWANMPNQLTQVNNDVANLISDCGEYAGTVYACPGSSTQPWYIDDALWYDFAYVGTRYDDIGYISMDETWEMRIADCLDDGYPVIYHGYEEWNIADWHLFVVDGYKGLRPMMFNSGLFHINWGWYGSYQGTWFDLGTCDPPGDPGPYDSGQGVIHPIRPQGEVIITSPVKNQSYPTSTPLTIDWNSTYVAGWRDSAMIHIMRGVSTSDLGPLEHSDTVIRAIPNDSATNHFTFMFPPHNGDTISAWIQITVYGKTKYRSEMIPFKLYQGEFMNFVHPSVGTIWPAGMPHTVEWDFNRNTDPHFLLTYRIVLGTGGFAGVVVPDIQDSTYTWMIPQGLQGTYVLEGVSKERHPVYSRSEVFTIGPPPEVNITLPVPNAQYQPGEVMAIHWTSNLAENVKIKLRRYDDWDPGDTLVIAASTPNDGIFDWTIPTTFEPGTLYELTVRGVVNSQILDVVSYFTIKNKIKVNSPTTGNNWEMTTIHYIEWEDNFTENVNIQLYKGTVFQSNLIINTASDGSCSWTVSDGLTPAANYRIRINKTGDEATYAYSNYFTISVHRYIDVVAPADSSEWQKGLTHNIKWNTNVGNLFKIRLIESSAHLSDTTLIATNVSHTTGGYPWLIPTTLNDMHHYQILITSLIYPSVSGVSQIFDLTTAPYIVVAMPTGTTQWPTATTQNITWMDNLSGYVEIKLYAAGGLLTQIIASSAPSTGSFSWFIPQTLTPGSFYILVTSLEYGSSVQDASDNFTITQGDYILVTAPASGTSWEAGTKHNITWNDNISANVRIILRKPSLGISDTLVQSTPSDGVWSWMIPSNQVPATNYNIRIESVSNSSIFDLSDPFEVYSTSGDFITVLSPAADSSWKKGTQHYITWDDNLAGGVHIDLYKNNVFVVVISSYQTGNSYLWTVPTSISGGRDYQVRIFSGSTYDFSEEFVIKNADYITYTGPAVYRMGDTTNITWTDNIIEHVKIELLHADTALTGDTVYETIVTSTPSDGSYNWAVPTNLPTEIWYKIKISRVGTPALSNTSNYMHIYFPFYINVTHPEAGNIWLKDSSYAIQWTHNLVYGEYNRIDLFKGGDSLKQIRGSFPIGTGYYTWNINSLYNDLFPGKDYSIRVRSVNQPLIYGFSEVFTILDCDSLVFSIGSDTTLYTNGSLDLYATEGFDTYFWQPFQSTHQYRHYTGSMFPTTGQYPVWCWAVSPGGCMKRDTIMLTVQEPPCIAEGDFSWVRSKGAGGCNVITFTNQADSGFSGYFSWNLGDGTLLDTMSFHLTHTYSGPGNYIVTCTAKDTTLTGCMDIFIDTVRIDAPPVLNFTYTISQDTALFVPSVTGTGNYMVSWKIDGVPPDIHPAQANDSQMYVFPDNGSYSVCLEVYDSLSPSCIYSKCKRVVVTTVPPCKKTTGYFAYKPHDGYGSGNRNTFDFTGGINHLMDCNTVYWNMGDGTHRHKSLSFTHQYPVPGMYIVTLTITDCGSCSFTHTDTVIANTDMVAGLPSSQSGCDSVLLSPAPGYFYYVWNDSTENRTKSAHSSGNYWVLVADDIGFYLRDTTHVTVSPSYHPTMSAFPVLCSDDLTYPLAEGNPSGGTYAGDHIASNIFYIQSAGPGFHLISYSFPGSNGCSDTAYGIIEVEPLSNGVSVIQNKVFDDTSYLTGHPILVGNAVTDTLPHGPVIVQPNGRVTLKAADRISLLPGTKVLLNGCLKATIGPLACTQAFIPGGDQTTAGFSETARAESRFQVAPNPTDGKILLLAREGKLDGFSLSIFDSRGVPVIKEKKLSGQYLFIDLGILNSGMYFLKVWNEKYYEVEKIIRK